MKIIVKTIEGGEQELAKELQDLGIEEMEILRRAVSFNGRKEQLYKVNYHSRLAIRVLVHITSGEVNDQDDLYKLCSTIKWTDYFDVDKTIAVNAVESQSVFNHKQFITYKAKDAIVDQFRNAFGKRPNVDNKDADVRINVQIYKNNCNISLDASGRSLHKRGYRVSQGHAPMSEVLAALIIAKAQAEYYDTIYDPMCGSGTFSAELIMRVCNIPAGYFSPNYAFQNWKNFDADLWQEVLEAAEENIVSTDKNIYCSDQDPEALSNAKSNLVRLRPFVRRFKMKRQDMFAVERYNPGLVLLNPPYDERIKLSDVEQFYSELGTLMKHGMRGSMIWLLSSNMQGIKKIGLKPSSKHNLLNGRKECKLLEYEIFDGKYSDHKAK